MAKGLYLRKKSEKSKKSFDYKKIFVSIKRLFGKIIAVNIKCRFLHHEHCFIKQSLLEDTC